MPELEFGDTDEQAIVVLKGFAHRVNNDLYNHGTKGLVTTFATFVARHEEHEETMEEVQKTRHHENSAKMNLLLVLATIGLLIVAAASLFVSIEAKRSHLDPAHLFHSKTLDPLLTLKRIPPTQAGSSVAVHY
jgi:hypothetical protein